MSTRKQTKGFLLGALAGGVVGSITALLLAPKAGKELRQDISANAQKVSDTTVKVAGQVSDTTGRIAKQIGGQAVQIADRTKQAAGSVVSSVKGWTKTNGASEVTDSAVTIVLPDGELETSAIEAVEAGETEAAASKEL
ncbi:YtxH domain-containing protein [Paenibacillus prosopidis]|uniref:YtxH-like protein n=1 Tax=Paenibacillus prosopidis TaxID=630520 RepID=A0A368VUP6_9BACL|nr:YtxH domain-containing protein [Paenibacillus prosopidis]RCW45585.1 YtxH-like protein [Paenibacillus prosopidis]